MNETLQDRLQKIEAKICDKEFLKNKGLGNEVGYYIFDYLPHDELAVRAQVSILQDKYDGSDGKHQCQFLLVIEAGQGDAGATECAGREFAACCGVR